LYGDGIVIFANTDDNIFINNTIHTSGSGSPGFYIFNSSNNTVSRGSIISDMYVDYDLISIPQSNTFENTDFSATRRYRLIDNKTYFNYSNGMVSG